MARKYSGKKRMNKIEPAVMTLSIANYNVGPGAAQDQYLDLSQIASLVNRRFYRQGINWAVAGFKIGGPTGITGEISISKLPTTWVLSNAWEKSMRTWMKMNESALAESESVRPRFLDFKIYANADHHLRGFANNLMPLSLNGGYNPGEWESSKIVIPRTDSTTGVPSDREIVAVGANYPGAGASGLNAVSMIEGYAASRGLPNIVDPNTPDDSSDTSGVAPQNWMSAVFNEGLEQTENIIEDMITENNLAPYPFEGAPGVVDTQYPGGANQGPGLEVHDFSLLTSTTVGGITRLKGGNFPCGLVNIRQTGFSESATLLLQVDLIPGNHRGYLCEPMTEM